MSDIYVKRRMLVDGQSATPAQGAVVEEIVSYA
jgi:hypothetical protein